MSQRKDTGLNINPWPKLVDHYIKRPRATPTNLYEISLSDINTPEKLNRHILNLSTKAWVTKDVIYRVMKLAGNNSERIYFG